MWALNRDSTLDGVRHEPVKRPSLGTMSQRNEEYVSQGVGLPSKEVLDEARCLCWSQDCGVPERPGTDLGDRFGEGRAMDVRR